MISGSCYHKGFGIIEPQGVTCANNLNAAPLHLAQDKRFSFLSEFDPGSETVHENIVGILRMSWQVVQFPVLPFFEQDRF